MRGRVPPACERWADALDCDLNIPIADDRLDEHQAMTKKRQEANPPETKPRRGKRR